MGMTVWVLSEDEFEDSWDHSLLLEHEKTLQELAQKIGVTKLADFYDNSILEEELGGTSEPFFSSAEDVEKSLMGLINAINDGQSEKLATVEFLLEELEDCLQKVILAKENGKKVRLAIVP